MTDYTRSDWWNRWGKWLAVAAAVAAVWLIYSFGYNTGYGAGHADGIGQLACIERAMAQRESNMTADQRIQYEESIAAAPGNNFPECK